MSDYDSAPQRETNTGLLVGSILATVLCCIPAGIVAIVFAAQGKDQQAKTWLIVAVVLGLVVNVGGWFVFFND
jgi:uncharacterized membrane protein YozB (DUF420 family)